MPEAPLLQGADMRIEGYGMYLNEILAGVKFKPSGDLSAVKIKNITNDSRSVGEGDLFIAIKGCALNGYKFIDEAIRKGAAAIVAEEDFNPPEGLAKIIVNDTREAVPVIADNFYGHPSQKLKVIGITGTNGKTTITYILENIVKASAAAAGVIGTINYRFGDIVIPAKNTTPGPLELQSMLSDMAGSGIEYAVMEVSSHSLDQRRVDRLFFDAGIFTNITNEHLDYHKTLEGYFKAKASLFDRIKPDGMAVLNADDERVAGLKNSIKGKAITYGLEKKSDIKAGNIRLSLEGSSFTVNSPEWTLNLDSKLIGRHNVSNITAAVAASFSLGIGKEAIKMGVESTRSVPGRLESIDAGQAFKVFVDYAHTEDALKNVLSLLQEVAHGRIITVFGCGGNRDRAKRPLMGIAACSLSNHVIITSDNPRFEEPDKIIAEIEEGIKGRFDNYDVIADRSRAIEKAIRLAFKKEDTVIIAGKGHENYQVIKDRTIPFDDRKVVFDIIKGRYEDKRNGKGCKGKAAIRRS